MIARLLLIVSAALMAAGCARAPADVTFHAADNPERLSDWGLFEVAGGHIIPRPRIITYALATPLFSDYAQKWRTVWMPPGTSARYDPARTFDFPVGTIVSKTFYYPVPASAGDRVLKATPAMMQTGVGGLDLAHVRMIETRLLVRRASGWVALPYVWNAEQTEATLMRTGAEVPLDFVEGGKTTRFVYTVPNANQCAGCHTADFRDRKLAPIGLKARHLNHDFAGENQLIRLEKAGFLSGAPAPDAAPRNADWMDEASPLDARARSYLDINCAHCHSATGPARVSGLWLDTPTADLRKLGLCKPPVAAGRGTGDRPFGIVPGHPDRSILEYRLASTDPGEMMPETGRSLVHQEGLKLIGKWIAGLKGDCTVIAG